MNVFIYDNLSKQLDLNEPELLLVKEFKALIDRDKAKNHAQAFKELTYIYLEGI